MNHYSTKDGLPARNITAIISDPFDQLWIGSSNGVARFDGAKFSNYYNMGKSGSALQGNSVYSMLSTPDTSIWVSTFGGGISIYDFEKNRFETRLKSDQGKAILENRVTGMHLIDSNKVMIHYRGLDAMTGGVSILDTRGSIISHELQEIIQDDGNKYRFHDVVVDDDVVHALGYHLYTIDTKTLEYTKAEFPFKVNRYSEAEAIEKLDNHRLLVGSVKGLYVYDTKTKSWEIVDPSLNVKQIILQDSFHLILTSRQILRYDSRNNHLDTIVSQDAFEKWGERPSFNSIYVHKGYLWLGTNAGLWSIRIERPIVESNVIKIRDKSVKAVRHLNTRSDGHKFFIGMNGNIFIKQKQHYSLINKIPGIVHAHVPFSEDEGIWLIGSDKGVFIYNSITNRFDDYIQKNKLDSLKNKGIWSLHLDSAKNMLWIGSRKDGLFAYDIERRILKNFKNEIDNPFSLCFDRYLFKITEGGDNNLWISTDKGLSLINPLTEEWIRHPEIVDALREYTVHHSAMGNQYMWIGTRDHGLYRYEIERKKTKIYTRKDGLPFTGVNRIVCKNGLVFCSTKEGIVIINEKTDAISVFDERHGIDHKNLYYSQLKVDERGDLLISAGNENVIYRIAKEHFFNWESIPIVKIESLSIINPEADTIYHYPSNPISLKANQNSFLISYNSVNFQNLPIIYRYKIDGYDKNWIYAGDRKTVNYANLDGGTYTFQLQSALAGRPWEQTQSLTFKIDHFWYKTIWFRLLLLTAVLCAIGLLYRTRVQKIKLTQEYQQLLAAVEMKALRSQMNPHFIFNSLNSIKSFIVVNDRHNATDYLNKFSKLIRIILNHSKSDVVPVKKELEAIKLYIQIEKLRFEGFDFEMNVDQSIDQESMLIPPMIIQPYLENAIWHGLQHKLEGDRLLSVHFEKAEDHFIHLCIKDNGVGREKAQKLKSKSALQNKSFGMSITEERINLASDYSKQNSITITDIYKDGLSKGTEVRILLPYKLQKGKA